MKRTSVKRILWSVLVILIIGVGYGLYYINSLLPIITGYPAKYLCSAVFVSGREQAEVEAMDLHFSFIKYTKSKVDFQDSSVTTSFLWAKSKAIYRKGFGATLLRGVSEGDLRKIKFPRYSATANQDTISWPMGNLMPKKGSATDTIKLERIAEKLMDDEGYNGHAFAFMVVHKGIPVVEAYQPQFNAQTRFLSWSMAKSFTNTLSGIMVKDGKWDINQPVNLPEWQADERKNITINNLLQMQSGLRWNEDYGNRSDVTQMLYCENDFAKFTYDQPFAFPAGSHWYYSSGSVNVVNFLMRKTIGNDNEYYNFAQSRLFTKIGMPDAVFEVDASGTQVGSSYIYATARDYARFGMLYLQDGVFNGERILPEGWVKYTTTPASDSDGKYGSLFWLNRSKYYPAAPEDMYSCNGHDGQQIFIIPSKELVVVLVGYSPKPDRVMKFNDLLGDVLSAIY
ncbi:beta-lactamase class C and other penicillin binding proteins [Aquipluma nitroreducens]|uniref:Beta-lactamase class C and other penicillin binding proteins n=1 Tax=Aquipluma nitroreducens TaxID=2010828 RepID=A0A5K7SBL0_9BACT|nr:serine hydrolase [Aquipluma nitroreducens]BBE18846.1 beta-lactamase class C and other penicillin binding proteins [Aquipluma nitroreducens]